MPVNKIFRNRIFYVVICSILALACLLAYSAIIDNKAEEKEVVRFVTNVNKGQIITEEMLEVKKVGGYNLAQTVLTDKKEVVGKYTLADFSKGDLILAEKVTQDLFSVNDKLTQLDGSRVALSITITDFANGLSDKLLSGDIVSVIATKEQATTIPPELTYVEVLATTTGNGLDKESTNNPTGEEENLASATLLVTPAQATELTKYEDTAEIHLALVYRGNAEQTKAFLDKQSEVLNGNISNG